MCKTYYFIITHWLASGYCCSQEKEGPLLSSECVPAAVYIASGPQGGTSLINQCLKLGTNTHATAHLSLINVRDSFPSESLNKQGRPLPTALPIGY